MKRLSKNRTMIALGLFTALGVPALAQIAVFDAVAIGKAVEEIQKLSSQYTQLLKQYNQLVRTYTMITNQYAQMVANARGLGQLPRRFLAPFTHWKYPMAPNRYGTSYGWVNAILSGLNAPAGYQTATLPLNAYDWSHISAGAQVTDSINYSTVELTDGLTQNSMATIGGIQADAANAGTAIEALESNTDSPLEDPSEVQALQNIASAHVIALHNQQDTNQLLAILMEQQTIGQKAQRDAFAESITNEIAYSNNAQQLQDDMFAGTDDAMNQLGVLP